VDVGLALDDFKITGPESGPAVAQFSASVTSNCVNETITFTNESNGSITSLEWDFGSNASPQTASGLGPHDVVYTQPGSYTVSLTAMGIENGEQIEQKVEYIKIGGLHTPSFTIDEETLELSASEADEYQWLFEGDTIQNATAKTYTVTEDGVYSVLTSVDGCVGESESQDVSLIVTSIDKFKSLELSLYPNPIIKSYLNIDNPNSHKLHLEILDVSGKLFKNLTVEATQQTIDVSGLKPGIYFAKIYLNNDILIQKIIKE